ncbi:MAG: HAD family hydrolase [Candidatus Bathyarchaeia archaeon]
MSGRFVSDFLVSRGYEVYPQALDAAWHYVSFVDYPKFGFESWEMWLKQVCNRLGVNVDNKTIKEWSSLYKEENWKLYPDVADAFNMAKMLGLKTAIVTSIAKFMYIKALKPILDKVDFLVDAFTFHCEKSNPKIYREALKTLKIRPEQAVMIGDEEDVDILLPKRLGMRAIFLDRAGKFQKLLFEVEPDAIVNNLVEAIRIVENWIVSRDELLNM